MEEEKDSEQRDDLQSPLVHEGAPPEQHDGNEDADDLVEVVEPGGATSPRVPNEGGRSAQPESGEEASENTDRT